MPDTVFSTSLKNYVACTLYWFAGMQLGTCSAQFFCVILQKTFLQSWNLSSLAPMQI